MSDAYTSVDALAARMEASEPFRLISDEVVCQPARVSTSNSSGFIHHPGGNPGANRKSISHRYYLFEVAFVCELTKETIVLPLGCLQGGQQLWFHSVCVRMALGELRRVSGNHFTEICCGTETGSYLRLIDFCITQLKAQGPSRTCNESKEEEGCQTQTVLLDCSRGRRTGEVCDTGQIATWRLTKSGGSSLSMDGSMCWLAAPSSSRSSQLGSQSGSSSSSPPESDADTISRVPFPPPRAERGSATRTTRPAGPERESGDPDRASHLTSALEDQRSIAQQLTPWL